MDELLAEYPTGRQSGGRRAAQRPARRGGRRGRQSRRDSTGEGDAADDLIGAIDRTAHPQVGQATSVRDRALWILRIAHNEHGIEWLSSVQVARVLSEKFRVRTTRQAVQQALDRAGELVDRDPRGSVVLYRIMDPGERHLDAPPSEENGESPRPRARTKRKRSGRSNATATASKAETKRSSAGRSTPTQRARRAGRQSPAVAVRELVAGTYFQKARTIGEIRDHLDQKQARKYKVTELSPVLLRLVRDGVLDREKNSEGQYEYTGK
jgi:hypothetical protein